MRIICEFCENEVELTGNMTCPHCGGILTGAAQKERERLRKEEEAERLRQAEIEKERQKTEQKRLKAEAAEADNEKWGKILSGAALLPFLNLSNLFGSIGRDLRGFFKILGVIVLIVIIIVVYRLFFK